MATESKSVSRGVLWLVVMSATAVLLLLAQLSAYLVNQRIDTLDRRGLENQLRITTLERQYAVIDTKQDQTIQLLREHISQMRQDGR